MNELIHYIINFRVVSIRGEMGFGKTLLAFAIAQKLLEDRYVDGVVSNVPNILPPHIWHDDGTLLNRCMVFDEAGMLGLDSRTSITNTNDYGAFARKFGAIFIFPSVIPVDKRLRGVELYPLAKNKLTGMLTYGYQFAGQRDPDQEKEIKLNPKPYYGLYSTGYIPVDDCGMIERFQLTHAIKTGKHKNDDHERQQRALLEAASLVVDVD
jgi:hypothetical protein